MIKSFADKSTEALFCEGVSKAYPSDICARAIRKLDMIDNAFQIEDLRVPPGNHLHRLHGDRFGQYAISINDQWRICFNYKKPHAYDVEICGYH